MKRRLAIYVIIFIVIIAGIKCLDVVMRYDIGILDYIRFSAPLSDEERAYLKNGDLKYGVDMSNAPFAFIDPETGQSTGIIVDYFNQLAVALETNMQPMVFDQYHVAIKLKTEDVEMAVLNRNAINDSVFSFSQTLYTERSKVLVNGEAPYESISDIRDISIAVISGSAAHHAVNKFFSPTSNVDVVLTDSLEESFTLLGLGQVDAIIGDEAKISYHLNQALRSNRFKFVEGSVSEEDVGIAVNRDDQVLLNIINKGILVMKENDQYSHINSKWFGSFIPEINESTATGTTANIISLIVVLFGAFFIWNKTVANKVNVRTKELEESRQNLRDIIDSINMGVLVSDPTGKINAVNKALIDMLGCDYGDLIDKNRADISGLAPFENRANEKEAFFYNGRYYLVYARELREGSTSNILIIDDYTDRHRYESLNRQEAKMIAVGELTAGLAHEIRNPLGLIKNYLFLLKKKIAGEKENHAVEVMDDSVNRINRLIENMLGFSRLSMVEATFVDLSDSVTSAMDLEKDTMDKRNIGLELDFGNAAGKKLKINDDVLKLCLINLTKNSLDAFDECDKESKHIGLKFSKASGRLKMDFEDNASGIPRDKLDQIFDPFFTTKDNGTGLGLYILQSEVMKIGGNLTVESVPGEGTVFHLELPIEEEMKEERK